MTRNNARAQFLHTALLAGATVLMSLSGAHALGGADPVPRQRSEVLTPQQNLQGVNVQLVKVADGLNDPVSVTGPNDGSGRLFIVERPGVVRIVQNGKLLKEPFLDISREVLTAFLEQGLYDLEFHPNFKQNGQFFVHFAELLRNGDGMIVRYQVSKDNPNKADPKSAKVIMQIPQPYANHNGGELAFGPDGYLYIGSGDGGWEGDPLEAGQNLGTLLGKVLRIDVNNQDNRAYAIPEGNPFSEKADLVKLFGITEKQFSLIHTEARPEIWAYGLRNPYKFSFDRKTGDLYLPDVGQNHWEEINFQPVNAEGGVNYGWDFLMGSHCFPIQQDECAQVGVLPVAEYSHDLGCAVIDVGVYRGRAFPNLDGVYFAGDFCSGRLWGLKRVSGGPWQFGQVLDTKLRVTGGGQDEAGELYVTSCECGYGGHEHHASGGQQSGNKQQGHGQHREGQGGHHKPGGAVWRIVAADRVPPGAETAR